MNLAKSIAGFALDKKATEVTILDMRKVANFCDYFVICTGNSDRHVKAIADGIEAELESEGVNVPKMQGARDARWIVIDLGHIIVHVFEKQTRGFYGLEYLWQDAKKVFAKV